LELTWVALPLAPCDAVAARDVDLSPNPIVGPADETGKKDLPLRVHDGLLGRDRMSVHAARNRARIAPVDNFVAAIRGLFRVQSAGEVRDLAVRLVEDLGAITVPADEDDGAAVPIDISFGAGPVLLPVAGVASVERMLVERFLPLFVEDAQRALALSLNTDRLAQDASVDPLTGLANRRASGRVLGRLRVGDAVALVDLDHFRHVNNTLGHEEGDRVLRSFGQFLHDELRGRDHAGRRGGEEFLIVLPEITADAAVALFGRLHRSWETIRPHPVGFSAGVALVEHGGNTIVAADRALYRAKAAGRGRTEVAHDGEYT
jgi:diguanylate cyclase (GGDEF)-like protein